MTATLGVGIAYGGVESIVASVFGGAYRDFYMYWLFVIALALRPQGLFGRRQ